MTQLNSQVAEILAMVPPDDRKLVTGHESMGYFAQRYGFKLVGVIVPSLSSQAEVSAADLAALKQAIEANHVKAIFTELGTSPAVAEDHRRRDRGESCRADHPRPSRRRYVFHFHDGYRRHHRRRLEIAGYSAKRADALKC